MKVTIINENKYVSVDGIGYDLLSFSLPEDIIAVQWNETIGEVEFKEVQGIKPVNEIITSLDSFSQAYEAWVQHNEIVLNPPALTEEQSKEQCKATAKALLSLSDWSVLPDVPLVNKTEFESYRLTLRNLVISPVVNPTYPAEPQPIWA